MTIIKPPIKSPKRYPAIIALNEPPGIFNMTDKKIKKHVIKVKRKKFSSAQLIMEELYFKRY
tara:strand:- start:294 stop:479 length:186 start_codon:yes stop_codon:yes gene_type:complete